MFRGRLGIDSGKPYYCKDRVAVAAYRRGLSGQRPTDKQWYRWADSTKPAAPPLLTFGFHRLANECCVTSLLVA
jgi:hypothetical protein